MVEGITGSIAKAKTVPPSGPILVQIGTALEATEKFLPSLVSPVVRFPVAEEKILLDPMEEIVGAPKGSFPGIPLGSTSRRGAANVGTNPAKENASVRIKLAM